MTGFAILGINDAGWTTGGINFADGSGPGFSRDPEGNFQTFSAGTSFAFGRAIGNDNSVIGFRQNGPTGQQQGIRVLADGSFSLLRRPSDQLVLAGISQGINASGTIVGNFRATVPGQMGLRNHAYILGADNSFVDLFDATRPTASVNARGIADNGTVVGWQFDGIDGTRGWIYTGGALQYLSHPGDLDANGRHSTIFQAVNDAGTVMGGYSQFVDAETSYSRAFSYDAATGVFTDVVVPGANNVQTFGINDLGRYVVSSDAGQFIYDPTGPIAPDGSSVFMPVAGANLPDGQSQFAITVTPGTTYYIDPALASGFEFLAGSGPLFASVVAPSGIGTDNQFSLWLWNGTAYAFDTQVTGGVAHGFASAVDRFELRGIPAGAGIGVDSHAAFITGLTFASAGQFNGFQIALAAVPEPGTWATMLVGFGLIGSARRRRQRVAA